LLFVQTKYVLSEKFGVPAHQKAIPLVLMSFVVCQNIPLQFCRQISKEVSRLHDDGVGRWLSTKAFVDRSIGDADFVEVFAVVVESDVVERSGIVGVEAVTCAVRATVSCLEITPASFIPMPFITFQI